MVGELKNAIKDIDFKEYVWAVVVIIEHYQIIKNKLAAATAMMPPTASLHLFLFQNASFFILLA